MRKPGTVGLPLPGQEVRVVDQDGRPVPQGERGEVVVAHVALRPESAATAEQMHVLCAERLAKYKRPVAIEPREALPKNAIGKIDKPALRALAG